MTGGVLSVVRWRDLVDILVVTFIVYRILLVFRGTRALQMLVGLGVLALVSLGARRLELHSLDWILDNFWSFWVIALVVLFQPELRRALERVGQGGALRTVLGSSPEERAQVIDEVARLTHSLGARRVGALIVLERSGGLDAYAELGVPLDAVVTADLLESIFVPSAPLHDGAVLVQGPRVVAAGCFLPLSRNLELGRALGTRHRAALGISEETDAVAVVVSEETGRVSLAVEGRLESVLDDAALRQRLAALIEDRAPGGGRRSFWRGMRGLLRRARR
jgi:diadenylate cyclase